METLLAASPNAFWYLMRGSGIVSLAMLTIVSLLGIATALNWSLPGLPRFATQALHRSLSLGSLIFLVIHVVTAIMDTYVNVSITDVVIPFASSYRPLYLGLGTLVLDVMLMLIATSLVRDYIGVKVWRALHWSAYACLPLALVHGLLIGTDTSKLWLEVMYGLEALIAVGVVAVRVNTNRDLNAQERFEQTTKLRRGIS